jgi:hypothetical protein
MTPDEQQLLKPSTEREGAKVASGLDRSVVRRGRLTLFILLVLCASFLRPWLETGAVNPLRSSGLMDDDDYFSGLGHGGVRGGEAKTPGDIDVNSHGKQRTVHVLYGLSAGPTVMSEFEVSLKSVLVNAPVYSDLEIHVIVDSEAHRDAQQLFHRLQLDESAWRNQVSIFLYPVSDGAKAEQLRRALEAIPFDDAGKDPNASSGTFFRLFAHEILPPTVESVAYFDNDLVVITHLDEINALRDDRYLFQAGTATGDLCAGMMILNLRRFTEFWDYLPKSRLPESLKGVIQDQIMLDIVKRLVNNELRLGLVKDLPPEWHVHLAHGFRRQAHTLRRTHQHFGFLHFNGMRAMEDEWFKGGVWQYCLEGECRNNETLQEEFRQTWMLAEPYVHMPWSMAKYLGKGPGPGNKILIETRCPTSEPSCGVAS